MDEAEKWKEWAHNKKIVGKNKKKTDNVSA